MVRVAGNLRYKPGSGLHPHPRPRRSLAEAKGGGKVRMSKAGMGSNSAPPNGRKPGCWRSRRLVAREGSLLEREGRRTFIGESKNPAFGATLEMVPSVFGRNSWLGLGLGLEMHSVWLLPSVFGRNLPW
jgi:hypothetical protein